ncbi:MAG: hypothetical protein KJZ70_16425, partial [Bryobacterales bacterium]|nr:hypothetical protein [Bryobacterales bacterium]
MSAREQLFRYLAEVDRRYRTLSLVRGAALVLLLAVVGTALAVAGLLARPMGIGALRVLQFALFFSLGLGIAYLVGLPLFSWTRRRTAGELERRNPELEQRLLTFAEENEKNPGNPFHELLARDAMDRAGSHPPEDLVPGRRIAAFAGGGIAGLLFLLWMIFLAPPPFGPGAALLWAGSATARESLLARVDVQPGNVTIRKGADQWITATVHGFGSDRAVLHVRSEGRAEWERIPMTQQENLATFEFLLAGVAQPLDYFVEADGTRSPQFRLKTIALPEIEKLTLSYQFPSWMAMPTAYQEADGDVNAVAGTKVTVRVRTDKPLEHGLLVFDDGTELPMKSEGADAEAAFTLDEKAKRTSYYIASRESDGIIRMSEDYFIKVSPEQPPVLRIARPGKDARVSPIEELGIQVSAEDDFGIQSLTLHYSVNGGEERTKALPFSKGTRQIEAEAMLYLEDFKLVPGDIVSYYASASDSRNTVRTDIYFAEAQPFEKNFSQSQVSGQPGQPGDEQGDIAQRQKEVIAATWNQIRTPPEGAALRETSQFLSQVQDKIKDQVQTLAQRMRARMLTESGESFKRFAEQMDKAAEEMSRAVGELQGAKWKTSIEPEQKALQALLRAQSMFRDIQVAQQQGGGGAGGSGASRDLESLLDLELDTEKNQYETGQSQASGGQQQQRNAELEAMLRRLEELARRQQELAEQAQRNQQQAASRWQQEMLRREAEELRKRMEQMAQQQSQGSQWQQQSMSRNQQGQQSQQGQSSQQGRQSQQQSQQSQSQGQQSARQQGGQQQRPQGAQDPQGLSRDAQQRLQQMRQQGVDPRLQQALNRLEQAEREMERAGSQNATERGQRDQATQSAARSLQEAESALRGIRSAGDEEVLDQLAEKAGDLANRQQESSNKVRETFGASGARPSPESLRQNRMDPEQRRQAMELYEDKQEIAEQIERLQSEMQQAARRLANNQRGAAEKLREGLREAQQDELGQRMRYSAELIRRGMGSMSYLREAPVGQGLRRLQEKLMEARDSLRPGGQRPADLAAALRGVERLRRSA